MYVQADSGSLDNVSAYFESGRRLLLFFPPNESLAALASLEAQFNHHKQFKNERMAALGWQFGPSAAANAASQASPPDPQTVIAEGESVAAALTGILKDRQSCNTVLALGAVSSAVRACNKRVDEESHLRHYGEAQKLQVVALSFLLRIFWT